ncbi:MAG: hypothetical protein ACI9LM_005425 [Alteromonadaceae bacterium]|jgi:hypothetical protein
MFVSLLGLSACDSEPPELMKASKQFESDEISDKHVAYMRTNHMDALKHKRDETMYNGIRTEEHSLNACIDCHVPESHYGEVLRHTDQEHFCTTCHTYVAAKLDCFECHVDHPTKFDYEFKSAKTSISQKRSILTDMADSNIESMQLKSLGKKELMDLAFKHVNNQQSTKHTKSGGGSLKTLQNSDLELNSSNKPNQTQKTEELTSE